MLKESADVAQSISVILTCAFAIYGIDSWRREFVGKRRMELAEEALALFYQARDAIDAMRSPFGYAGEGTTRKPSEGEDPEDKDALDHAFTLVERYQRHAEMFSRSFALRYRFMAQLGVDAAEPFDGLGRVINELMLASRRLSRRVTKRERERPYKDASEAKQFSERSLKLRPCFTAVQK